MANWVKRSLGEDVPSRQAIAMGRSPWWDTCVARRTKEVEIRDNEEWRPLRLVQIPRRGEWELNYYVKHGMDRGVSL